MTTVGCYSKLVSVLSVLLAPAAVLACEGDPAEPGWLGVQLDVPESALCTQLRLNDRGLVVTNVCAGSPADQAGLQQYDDIISFNGEETFCDIAAFAKAIRDLGNGASADCVVKREAEDLPLTITLGTRAERSAWNWKYDYIPDEVLNRSVAVSGQVVRITPDGDLVVEDLGAMPNVPHEYLATLLPAFSSSTLETWLEDGQLRRRSRVDKDGVVFEIEKSDSDEDILVRRIVVHGGDEQVQERDYEDETELESHDPEAFEVYSEVDWESTGSAGQPTVRMWNIPQVSVKIAEPHFAPLLDLHNWRESHFAELEKLEDWRSAFEDVLSHMDMGHQEAIKKFEAALEAARAAREHLEQHGVGVLPHAESAMPKAGSEKEFRFDFAEDGQVTVTIRKGDTELVKAYRDRDQLREKNPALYERFLKVEASE